MSTDELDVSYQQQGPLSMFKVGAVWIIFKMYLQQLENNCIWHMSLLPIDSALVRGILLHPTTYLE
jgi:hypothetical protein